MSKTIYWIDDNIERMNHVVQGIISKFWKLSSEEPGIMSKIIIFGNASLSPGTEALWTQEDEDDFNDDLHRYFKQQCRNVDAVGTQNITYEKNKNLIYNPTKILYKEQTANNDKKLYQEVMDCWSKSNLEDESSAEYIAAKESVGKLINKMDIPEKEVVGIDLELIFGDFKDCRVSKRILSMELYHQLKEKHKCFLYSTEGEAERITNSWKEKYRELYKPKEGDNIIIYNRGDIQYKGNEDVINRIEEILEQ